MKLTKNEIVVGSITESTGLHSRRPHLLSSLVTTSVCANCNNGWMSRLEKWFQIRAGLLIEPTWPQSANESVRVLADEPTTLAQWLIKTAITTDQASLAKAVVPRALYVPTKDGMIPDYTFVMLAHIHHPTLQVISEKGFRTMNAGVLHQNQEHKDGFSFTIQMNHLALRLVICPGGRPQFQAEANTQAIHSCVAMLPPHKSEGRFICYSFKDLNDFYQRVTIHTSKSE